MPIMLYTSISINQIDIEDQLFQLDHIDNSDLQWEGSQPLFNPVWLHQKSPTQYRIIDGFKVISRAKSLIPQELIAAAVFPEDSNLVQLWEQRMRKRNYESNLSTIAYLRGLEKLMEVLQLDSYPLDGEEGYHPPEIGLQTFNRQTLNEILEKTKYYEPFTDIQQLGYKELRHLDRLPAPVLNDLNLLFSSMQLKGKKLTSMLGLVDELKRGFGIQLSELLKDDELTASRTDLPPHQRYRPIKSRLLALRFPKLSKLLSEWDESLKLADLDKVVDIRHDPYFENDQLQFVFSPRNTADLKKRLQQVFDKVDSPELDRLFTFI
jgi:hypothetical protein